MILPSAAVPLYLALVGARRPFATAEGARARIAERRLRPLGYAPPERLRRDVAISAGHEHGWPVYRVTPSPVLPNLARAAAALVYVHGGGWVNEISPLHWRLVAQLAAEANLEVIVPIYRLVPFGTAIEARDGVAALVEEARARYDDVLLAGDSAGGQIALSAALALRDRGIALPLTTLVSPALDLSWSNPRIPEVQPSDPWLGVPGGVVLAEAWRGELPLDDPAVSPLAGELAGLGPLSVYSGTRDVLNPDARLLVERAQEVGVGVSLHERRGQLHVYPLLPTPVGRSARADIVAELRAAVRGGRATPAGADD
ncbi:alpha/beta hydrolase [Leucobacter allii]|uniref:Alpha/beta hydrolase n=1 Tax=Leucobacter allii TaxID=2932247 RepID=A0ABY4FGZ1_9MICO|nr:alpha/beta hydrolase fold domain-containing protein [Leucobacter allii]UOQ55943.1 alpha/beta hydrolase [Leucobacter allii]